MKKISAIALLLLVCWACQTEKPADKAGKTSSDSLSLEYAEGFKVSYDGNIKTVEVLYPFQGATSGYKYLLVPQGEAVPEHEANVRVIRTPISSIVCTSTTHIPLLDYINETDKLVGFTTTDFISSEKMRARIDAGK